MLTSLSVHWKITKLKMTILFIVGLNEHQQVVSMAHYEATTNSAFLIYLLAQDGPEHDNILDETLTHIEAQINSLSNKVHNRNVNFIMLEVPQTTPKNSMAKGYFT